MIAFADQTLLFAGKILVFSTSIMCFPFHQDLALAISDTDAVIKVIQRCEEGSSELAEQVLPDNLTLPDVAELKEFVVNLEAEVLALPESKAQTGEALLLAVMKSAGGTHGHLAILAGVLDRVLDATGALDALV